MVAGSSLTYTLPSITDPENDPCTVTFTTHPPWATFNQTHITFNPPSTAAAGTFEVIIEISDGVNNPLFSFNLILGANTPAVFLTTPMGQSTRSGVAISYTLPGTYDAESDPVTIGLTAGGLSFVTLT
jgi:hypothetical protein